MKLSLNLVQSVTAALPVLRFACHWMQAHSHKLKKLLHLNISSKEEWIIHYITPLLYHTCNLYYITPLLHHTSNLYYITPLLYYTVLSTVNRVLGYPANRIVTVMLS